jgi:hypothetical protein
MVIDQASSSTAFVNIRGAAEAGQSIPEGWVPGCGAKCGQFFGSEQQFSA